MHELILMKPFTVVVFNKKMCVEKDNPGPENIKGDNSGKK